MSRDVREIIRDEPAMRGRILKVLADGPHTVPEIAAALGCPSHEAMFWVMGLRKYGYVAEDGAAGDDGFFRYRALGKVTS